MIKCKKCDQAMERKNKFCPSCGSVNTRGLGCVIAIMLPLFVFAIIVLLTLPDEVADLDEAIASNLNRADAVEVLLKTGSIDSVINERDGIVIEWPVTISRLSRSATEFHESHSDYEIRVDLEFRDSDERKLFKNSRRGDRVLIKGLLTHSYESGVIDKKLTMGISPAFLIKKLPSSENAQATESNN